MPTRNKNPYLIEGMFSIVAGDPMKEFREQMRSENMDTYANYLNQKICPDLPNEIFFSSDDKSIFSQWAEDIISKKGYIPWGDYQQIAIWIQKDGWWLTQSRIQGLENYSELKSVVYADAQNENLQL